MLKKNLLILSFIALEVITQSTPGKADDPNCYANYFSTLRDRIVAKANTHKNWDCLQKKNASDITSCLSGTLGGNHPLVTSYRNCWTLCSTLHYSNPTCNNCTTTNNEICCDCEEKYKPRFTRSCLQSWKTCRRDIANINGQLTCVP